MITQFVMGVLKGTPAWVYVLFVALVAIGYAQTKQRSVSVNRLVAVPFAMTGYSLFGVITAFGAAAAGIAAWAAGIAGALAIGQLLKRPEGVTYAPASASFSVPGSWKPMALIMVLFFARYVINVALAMDPALRQAAAFTLAAALVYGVASGAFLSRAARIWSQRQVGYQF